MARLLLLIVTMLAGLSEAAFGQISTEIAPGGKLRVGMIAITVLGGVAEPVARFVGQKLGAAVEPVMYPNPEAVPWDAVVAKETGCLQRAGSVAQCWNSAGDLPDVSRCFRV